MKGKLIKGSGYLVSSKGRVINSAGNSIAGLGTRLASSAIVQPPFAEPVYEHLTHGYGSTNTVRKYTNLHSSRYFREFHLKNNHIAGLRKIKLPEIFLGL